MHEYPITQHIIEISSDSAKDNKVSKINLIMGDACGYLFESIELYFDLLSKGTACEGATISAEYTASKLCCRNCGELFIRQPFSFTCSVCGGEGAPTDIGREFYVKSIEVCHE